MPRNDDSDLFMPLIRALVDGNTAKVRELIDAAPGLVVQAARKGASRQESGDYFFPAIRHYLYAGDTPLHMAAAGFRFELCQLLLDRGAVCSAKNRRGAEPLHYAADANTWNPSNQAKTVTCLIRGGANPNAMDKSGVAPIHRAVRTRSAAAVQALLSAGARLDLPNGSGSAPLHLAVQNTGRGGSGTPEAIDQQREIIVMLLRNGASTRQKDGRNKTAFENATAAWIRSLLDSY